MNMELTQYVPSLKWRMGEYQSLFRLHESIKERVIPLVNVPPVEFDFEKREMKKTVHDHVEPFPKKFSEKWGDNNAFIDFHESLHDEFMNNGESIVNYVFGGLNALGHNPVPVTGISRSKNYQAVIKSAHNKSKSGLALRVKLDELMLPDISKHITDLSKYHHLSTDNTDLIIDLGAPQSFEPYDIFAKALAKRIKSIQKIKSFRSLIVIATSISISDVKPPGTIMPRHEWDLYKMLSIELEGIRVPIYGDYCMELPTYTSLDMRLIKPAGKVIYTTEDSWIIRKGKAFRSNESQMIQHCKYILESGHYKENNFSWGDEKIDKTAKGIECNKSMTIWKQVGFSHHITFVAEQLSIHHGS